MIISNKPLACVDCGEIVTPAQMKEDEMRIHEYNNSFYCDECMIKIKKSNIKDTFFKK